jgi:hypothetical protein
MLGVGFGKALDTKVINTQCKGGAFCAMAPEARSEWHGFVSVWSWHLDELVERQDACFLEAAESTTDFEIDVAIIGDVDVVAWIVPDLLRNA